MYYFDWTATTPVTENALKTYNEISTSVIGNPSSVHPEGLRARECLDNARKETASILKTDAKNIFFTSGGTESDSIVIQSLLNNPVPGQVIVSSIEHAAVLENRTVLESKGWSFTTVKCPGGYLSPEDLAKVLTPKTRMVCIMAVNNVTGTVLPLKALIKTVRDFEKQNGRKIHIHCDAVQAVGKLEFFPEELDIDSAAVSSHKFGGPRGVGILYCRNNAVLALSRAGGQEKGLRGGTENLAGICSMVTALKDAVSSLSINMEKVLTYRKQIEEACIKAGFTLLSPSCTSQDAFSPYILTISVKPLPSEVYLRIMADKGFCLSAGSACSTNSKGKAESVLTAMNFKPEDRTSAVRISISYRNTQEEIDLLSKEIK